MRARAQSQQIRFSQETLHQQKSSRKRCISTSVTDVVVFFSSHGIIMGLALHCCRDWPNWRDERRKKGQTHRPTTDILGSVQPCAFWWRCTSNSNLQTQHLYSLHLNRESGLIVCSWLRRHASQSRKQTFVESSLQPSLRKLWLTGLACMGQSFVNTCIRTEKSIAMPLNLTRERRGHPWVWSTGVLNIAVHRSTAHIDSGLPPPSTDILNLGHVFICSSNPYPWVRISLLRQEASLRSGSIFGSWSLYLRSWLRVQWMLFYRLNSIF